MCRVSDDVVDISTCGGLTQGQFVLLGRQQGMSRSELITKQHSYPEISALFHRVVDEHGLYMGYRMYQIVPISYQSESLSMADYIGFN